MTAAEVLERLRLDGVGVVLALDLEATAEPNPETLQLIREHRDDLITLLALRHISGSDYYLKISTSSGKAYVMAKPHHIDEAVSLYPWGVVYDSKDRLIATWGDVPSSALLGKVDLLASEPLVREAEAA